MIPRWRRRSRRELSDANRSFVDTIKSELQVRNAEQALTLANCEELSTELREKSLVLVAAYPDRAHIPALLHILRNAQQPGLSLQAAKALAAIGSRRATKPMLGIIRHAHADHLVFSCVYALWSLRDGRSERTLRGVVNNPEWETKTRGLAAEVLGMFPRSHTFLLNQHQHPIPDIRCGALYGAAVHARDPLVLEIFQELLHDNAKTSNGERVSDLAAQVLRPDETSDLT